RQGWISARSISPILVDRSSVGGRTAARANLVDHPPEQTVVAGVTRPPEHDRMPYHRSAAPGSAEGTKLRRYHAPCGLALQAHVASKRHVHQEEADLQDTIRSVLPQTIREIGERKAAP